MGLLAVVQGLVGLVPTPFIWLLVFSDSRLGVHPLQKRIHVHFLCQRLALPLCRCQFMCLSLSLFPSRRYSLLLLMQACLVHTLE
jgi:hypothetical protein